MNILVPVSFLIWVYLQAKNIEMQLLTKMEILIWSRNEKILHYLSTIKKVEEERSEKENWKDSLSGRKVLEGNTSVNHVTSLGLREGLAQR